MEAKNGNVCVLSMSRREWLLLLKAAITASPSRVSNDLSEQLEIAHLQDVIAVAPRMVSLVMGSVTRVEIRPNAEAKPAQPLRSA